MFIRPLFILAAAGIFLTGCELLTPKEDKSSPSESQLVEQLADLEQPSGLDAGKPKAFTETEDTTVAPVSESNQELTDGQPVTYTTTIKKFKASAAFDTQILLNPSTDVIYPGSVLLGSSIDDGSYKEITKGSKNSVTISYDLTGVKDKDGNTGIVAGKITPTLSAFRTLHNEVLGQMVPGQSSIYSYEATETSEESEFSVKFSAGVTFESPTISASVKGGMDFAKGSKKHNYMVKFMQTFYTVDIDQGDGTFLYKDFNIDNFGGYRPVYVSSVAYGRLAYLTITSEESWSTLKTFLDAAVTYAKVGATADAQTEINKMSSKSTINITVIGGTTPTTDVAGFVNFLETGGFSSENSGKIVSYKLRFVDDNSVANTVFNGEYTVRSVTETVGKGFEVVANIYKIKSQMDDSGDGAEYYGLVNWGIALSDLKDLWRYSSGSTFDMIDIGTKTWDGPKSTVTFKTLSDTVYLNTSGVGEDDLTGDEKMQDVTKTITLQSLWDASQKSAATPYATEDLTTTNKSNASDYLTFSIKFTITPKY